MLVHQLMEPFGISFLKANLNPVNLKGLTKEVKRFGLMPLIIRSSIPMENRSKWSKLPFILLTAEADTNQMEEANDLGVDAYITKPFKPEDIELKLKEIHAIKGESSLQKAS